MKEIGDFLSHDGSQMLGCDDILYLQLDGALPTSVCVHCDEIIRQWTLLLSKREKANSFSTIMANNQSLLYQLTSDTSNSSVPSKPSTSLCSTRLSQQVSNNLLHDHTYYIKSIFNEDCISKNVNSSFASPIEAIFIPDIKSEPDLEECETFLEDPIKNHEADLQPFIQIEEPAITASASLPGTERLQHPQGPRHITLHTSLSDKPSFCVLSNTQCSFSKNSSSLSDLNLLQRLVKKYHIKDFKIRLSRLSDQVLDSLQHNGTVDCNVVDNQMSEQRNVRIKLEPVTVDPSVCDDQVSDNLQQNPSSTVDDDDIEVPFEAIYDPVVNCKPDLVKCESSPLLSTAQFADVTVKQEEIGNADAYSDVQPGLPGLETSPGTSNPSSNKDVNISAPVLCSCSHCNITTSCKSRITTHIDGQQVKMSGYHCQECRRSFQFQSNLNNHISHVHPNKCSYKCLLCKRGFQLEKSYNAHVENHKSLQCDVCGKILSSKYYLAEHKMIIHTKSSANLQQNISSTVDDNDIEVPFEAIYVPVVKCEPDLVISEPRSDLSATQSINHHLAAFTVKQEEMENAEADSDVQRELETSAESSNPGSNKAVYTSASLFRCAHCFFITKYKSIITSHIVNLHVTMSSYQCQECRKSFEQKYYLQMHISRVHPYKSSYKCPQCKRGFQYEKRCNAHIKNHDTTLQCDECGKILSSKHYLAEHKMLIHTNSSPLSCAMCGKIFYTDRSFKAHLRQVHYYSSYKCDICDKSFKFKTFLREHQQDVHASVRAFSCNQCEKTFGSKSALKRHSVVHSDLRPFKCKKCNSCFKSKSTLVQHIGIVHSNVSEFNCHFCGKSYKSKGDLSRHLISHSDVRNYICEQCGKQFKTKNDLTRHLTTHSKMRPFACAQCHKKFKSKAELVKHLRYVHSNLRPFSCDKCSLAFKKFKSKAELVKHLRYVHSDLRPFSCDKCSLACKSKYDLKVHQLLHNNVRKFECYHCNVKFKYRNNLSAHIKTKHSNLH